jgi:hypothetical protein
MGWVLAGRRLLASGVEQTKGKDLAIDLAGRPRFRDYS